MWVLWEEDGLNGQGCGRLRDSQISDLKHKHLEMASAGSITVWEHFDPNACMALHNI